MANDALIARFESLDLRNQHARQRPADSLGSADLVFATKYDVEVRPLAALAPLAVEWRALAARAAEPNAFLEPAFALAAAPALGKDVSVGLVWQTGAPRHLVGLFPVRIERRYAIPLAVLTHWFHHYGPLGTPLVDRACAVDAIAAWLDYVEAERTWPNLLIMPYLPEGTAFDAALGVALARRGARERRFDRHQRAMLMPVDRASYLDQAVAAKKRKELSRQRRRLEECGHVAFTSRSEVDAINPDFEAFLAVEATGWKGRVGTAAAQDDNVLAFMREAVTRLAAEGKIRVDSLYLDGSAIAVNVTLKSGGAAWGWKTSYDESYARFSPGVQLLLHVTEQNLADPAIERVDSCASPDHPMIDHIWRERLALSDRLIALRPGPPFEAASRLEAARRAGLRAAKSLRRRLRGW
jgi:CelD/BcsL family acetyltransferase involved in cellulose biosynthesis